MDSSGLQVDSAYFDYQDIKSIKSTWSPLGVYESFDLSKTHSLSTQDLGRFLIHSFIIMTAGKYLKYKNMPASQVIKYLPPCMIYQKIQKNG